MVSHEAALRGDPEVVRTAQIPALTVVCRALLILSGVGFSSGIGLGLVLLKDSFAPYLTQNRMRPDLRTFVLAMGFGTLLALNTLGVFVAWRRRRASSFSGAIRHLAHRLSPLGVLGFLPLLFQWSVWKDRDLVFLFLVGLAGICFERGLRAAIEVGPFAPEKWVRSRVARVTTALAIRLPKLSHRLPLVLVSVAALGYTAYFSYYTIAWHWGVRSGWDLALENNLLWNILHGGEFMKSSPFIGPKGSHFGNHATLFAYVIAPIYAFAQRPETLLVIQSAMLGLAAIPLYLFARLHLSRGVSCFVALVYLLCPAVHGVNLYEFHYQPLSTFFLWLTLYALESKRDRLAIVSILLTLSIREDVSASLAIWGVYLLVTGKRPRVGLALTAVSLSYFVALKMFIMPRFSNGESFTFIYAKLLPPGDRTFGGVLKTVLANPWFTADTLLDEGKLIYALQMVVPLAFVPLRRPLALLFVLPGFFFTLLTTGYGPTISLHYQYNVHFTTFLFVALVLVLAVEDRVRRAASLGAIALTTVACSFQYGAVLQHHTSFGGPIPYTFGVTREDRRRRHALDAVVRHLPPDAKVSCSAFTTPQVSSRADAYAMTLGVYDANYLLFPSERADFIGDERRKVTELLTTGKFGIVEVDAPFALAERGHSTTGNATFLKRIR